MNKYDLSTFLSNMDKITKQVENKQKHEEIGKILSSLQQPFKSVLATVCEKQKTDVQNLLKSLGWK